MLYNYIYLKKKKKRNIHVFRVHVFYIMARLFKKSYTCTCSSYSSPRSYSTVFEENWCKGVKYFSTMIGKVTLENNTCVNYSCYIFWYLKSLFIYYILELSLFEWSDMVLRPTFTCSRLRDRFWTSENP